MSEGGEGWVDRLKRNLKIKIEQLTGDCLKVETASLPPRETRGRGYRLRKHGNCPHLGVCDLAAVHQIESLQSEC